MPEGMKMTESAIKRIMPHDDLAEQSVIGSMLIDRDAINIASGKLYKEDFYDKRYGILFAAMVELHDHGKSVDLVTLKSKLEEMNLPEEMVGMDFIVDTMNNTYTSANVKEYANIVSDKAVLRRLIKFSEETINKCYNPSDSLVINCFKILYSNIYTL